jgi:RNA polymerase sigma-70 factor (ECF subfamily)
MSIFNQNKEVRPEMDLINLAKKDSNHFTPIYNNYHEQIFRFVYKRTLNKDQAADITSQVFLKALINLKNYEFRGFPFSSWLYRIALNEVNQYYRKNKNKRIVNIDEENIKDVIEESGETFNEEKREKLLVVLSHLDQNKTSLIEMRFFEKRSFKEIGEILQITENNAKVRTYRVIEEMKKYML